MAIDVEGLIDHLQKHVRLNPDVADMEVYVGVLNQGEFELSGDFDILSGLAVEELVGRIVPSGVIVLDGR